MIETTHAPSPSPPAPGVAALVTGSDVRARCRVSDTAVVRGLAPRRIDAHIEVGVGRIGRGNSIPPRVPFLMCSGSELLTSSAEGSRDTVPAELATHFLQAWATEHPNEVIVVLLVAFPRKLAE